MAEDYYSTLEVQRTATTEEIEKAYKKLARKFHPDLNQDDPSAKEKFQKVQQAYDVLGDPEKREKYDQFGEQFEQMHSAGGARGNPFRGGTGQQFEFDLGDLFGQGGGSPFGGGGSPFGGGGMEDLFGQYARQQAGARGARQAPRRGSDLKGETQVSFRDAVLGGKTEIHVRQPDGATKTISATIPAGIEDGKSIRVRGQGHPSPNGGEPGDLLITVHIDSHPCFQRKGKNLEVTVPVTVAEAALGATVEVPTPKGTVSLPIPPATSSGKRLRLKGMGVQPGKGDAGDLFAVVQIVLPAQLDDEAKQLLESFAQKQTDDPRTGLQW